MAARGEQRHGGRLCTLTSESVPLNSMGLTSESRRPKLRRALPRLRANAHAWKEAAPRTKSLTDAASSFDSPSRMVGKRRLARPPWRWWLSTSSPAPPGSPHVHCPAPHWLVGGLRVPGENFGVPGVSEDSGLLLLSGWRGQRGI